MAIQFLELYSKCKNIKIIHAENDGEYLNKIINPITKKIFTHKVDGYCKETNTIFLFHGDFWHGNPKKYNHKEINPKTGTTYGELYNNTIKIENILKQNGYNLVVIWELDWLKLIKIVKTIQRKIRQ